MLTVETEGKLGDLRAIHIENEALSLVVLPELGAKIYSLVHRPSGRELLWQNPRLAPERAAYGAVFDDHWSGGWDELLPNDLPRPAPGGDLLPDHGEFWSQAADWRLVSVTPHGCELRFGCNGRVLPSRFEKTLLLTDSDPFLRIRYVYANLGPEPFPLLWNIHPAMAIGPDSRLDVPAGEGLTDPWHASRIPAGTRFHWPFVPDQTGRPVDLRRVEEEASAIADMHYLTDVREGWYAVTHRKEKVGFALRFPREVFPHVWLFRTFGGWRGLNTLILEASTGYPYDLEVAASQGTCRVLAPHETLEAEILAIPFAGLEAVAGVEPDGRVVAGKAA